MNRTSRTPSPVTADEIIARAVEAGWSDDSRWAPRFMQTALTREQDGMLATVSIYGDGMIRWTASPASEGSPGRGQRGTGASLADALRSALGSLQSATGTLF